MKEILKPPEVAKILGCSPQSVREHIRLGIWDIGEIVTAKKRGKTTCEYNIYRHKLYKMIGKEEPGNVTQQK